MDFKIIEHYEISDMDFLSTVRTPRLKVLPPPLDFNKNDKRPCSYSCMLCLIRKRLVKDSILFLCNDFYYVGEIGSERENFN